MTKELSRVEFALRLKHKNLNLKRIGKKKLGHSLYF